MSPVYLCTCVLCIFKIILIYLIVINIMSPVYLCTFHILLLFKIYKHHDSCVPVYLCTFHIFIYLMVINIMTAVTCGPFKMFIYWTRRPVFCLCSLLFCQYCCCSSSSYFSKSYQSTNISNIHNSVSF